MKDSDTQEIECAKCGEKIRVHIPYIAMAHDPKMSQATMFASWSLSERQCKQCGAINYPIIAKIDTAWVATDPPQEERKVSLASLEDIPKMRGIRP